MRINTILKDLTKRLGLAETQVATNKENIQTLQETPAPSGGGGYEGIEVVTVAKTITPDDTGKHFYVLPGGRMVLPDPEELDDTKIRFRVTPMGGDIVIASDLNTTGIIGNTAVESDGGNSYFTDGNETTIVVSADVIYEYLEFWCVKSALGGAEIPAYWIFSGLGCRASLN